MTHLQKALTVFLGFFALIATHHSGLAAPNDNPTVVMCTKRFNSCLTVCNHEFGTDRHFRGRRNCAMSCEDKLLACEESPS